MTEQGGAMTEVTGKEALERVKTLVEDIDSRC